jgi:hypothetical protein
MPHLVRRMILSCVAVLACRGAETASASNAESPALYFASLQEAVQVAGKLLGARDWPTLARHYDLTSQPGLIRAQLSDGTFFLDTQASATGPGAISRWRQPFAPGATLVEATPLDEHPSLPRRWSLTTALAIDQGGGPPQRVIWNTQMVQTSAGFQFFLPSLTTPESLPAPAPATDQVWQARGADAVLLYRPALRSRAEKEVPTGRSANIPDLVKAIERLKPLVVGHTGSTRLGSPPFEPATVYQPADEELLLSLAGDRIWRTLQIAPPGTVAAMRAAHPGFSVDRVEYPHIEITRVAVAGSGPRLYAQTPVVRSLNLKEGSP